MKKIDVRNITEWKITCELMDFSLEVGEGLEFDDLMVDLSKKNNLDLPKITSKPSILSLTGLDKHKSGKARQTVLAAALKSGHEYDQHVFLVNLAELDETCIEWLIKRQGAENILVINNVSQKTDQAYLRALRGAGFKAILWTTTSEDLVGIPQYLPNTDWLVIEGKMPRNNTVKARLSNIYWECYHQNIPFWSAQGINLETLLNEGAKQVVGIKKSMQDDPGYDFPDLGEYVLWDSQLEKEIDGKHLHSEVLNAQGQLARSTMQLAYRLFQLNETAIRTGKRAFYQLNFGVNNFGSYCENQLGIKANLGSQYLVAIRTVNALDQYRLQSVFDPGEDEPKSLPLGYTRFRDVSKYLGRMVDLKSTDVPGFEKLRAKIFDPALSNRDVISVTETELGIKRKKKALVQTNPDPTTRLKTRIIKIGSDLKSIVSPQDSEEVDKILLQLLALLPKPVITDNENPFEEEFGIVEDSTPDVAPKKKVSRETFSDEVEVDAPDSILPEGDDTDDKPTNHHVEGKIKDGKWKPVILTPEITGLKRPMEILTAPRGASFVKCAWHGDKDTFCPPIWADIALGSGACGFGCRTCFLMLTFRSMRDPSRPLVYTNYEKMDSDIRKWLIAKHYYYEDKDKKKVQKKRSYKETIGLGIDCADSLLFEGYTQNLRRIAPLFQSEKSNPLDTQLVLLTKSANTHFLKTVKPKNIIITMSLNPEGIADLWEGKYLDGVRITPPITERLEALKYAQDLGFETRIRLDPILTPDKWEEQYREFVNEMYELGVKPSFITLGTYREKNNQIDTWREKWGLPPAEVDSLEVGNEKEGTHFHIQGRNEIYSTVETIIKKGYAGGSFKPHISLCKETFSIRKELGMTNMYCNCLRSESSECNS